MLGLLEAPAVLLALHGRAGRQAAAAGGPTSDRLRPAARLLGGSGLLLVRAAAAAGFSTLCSDRLLDLHHAARAPLAPLA